MDSRRTRGLIVIAGMWMVAVAEAAAPTTMPSSQPGDIRSVRCPDVKFDGQAMGDAIEYLHDLTGVRIDVNYQALAEAGIDRDRSVTLILKRPALGAVVGNLLNRVDNSGLLAYTVKDGAILISTAEDLRKNGVAAADMVVIRGWRGRSWPEPTTQEIQAMWAKHLARHLPEMKFSNNQLADVIDFFRDITGTSIFVNWKALEQAGVDRAEKVSLRLRDIPAGQFMDLLLRSVGDGKTVSFTEDDGPLTITTRAEMEKLGLKPLWSSPSPAKETQAALEKKGVGYELKADALGDVLDLLSSEMRVNLFINWPSLKAAGIDKTTPVTLSVKNMEYGKVLTAVLEAAGKDKAQYTIEGTVVIVSGVLK